MADVDTPVALRRLLEWYVEFGADEAIGSAPIDRTAAPAAVEATAPMRPAPGAPAVAAPPPLTAPEADAANAREIAAACGDLAALRAAMNSFEGCALRWTATQLVFADGEPAADLMLVGEGPGSEEDRVGLPFVGAAGRLLDRMLAAIGLDRTTAYITNVLPWRPPGNRTPSANEVMVCLPFLHRHIELAAPRILVPVGGVAASALLGTTTGITRIRGRWRTYRPHPGAAGIPTLAIFHTAYLLRSPVKKREAWRDLLEIRRRLHGDGGALAPDAGLG